MRECRGVGDVGLQGERSSVQRDAEEDCNTLKELGVRFRTAIYERNRQRLLGAAAWKLKPKSQTSVFSRQDV